MAMTIDSVTVAIHQPNFLPRLKVLQKISQSDIWIVLDDVQYVSREWQNRARLQVNSNISSGYWLTIPISRVNGRRTLISDAVILAPEKLKVQLLKSIRHSYGSSLYWHWINEYTNITFESVNNSLVELTHKSTSYIFEMLNISTDNIQYASDLNVEGRKNVKLVNLCKAVGANNYILGSGGSSYLEIEKFENSGISLLHQNWTTPNCCLKNSNRDWRNHSFLDFVAQFGPNRLRDHLVGDI